MEVREFVEPVVSPLVRYVTVESRGSTDYVGEPVSEARSEPFVLAVVEHHRASIDETGGVNRRGIDLAHDHVRIDAAGESKESDLAFDEFPDPRERP